MSDLTDVELEQRAAAGDRDAFGELYERYSGRVYDFLLRMVREPADAADLMQETFVRALRSLKAERAGKGEYATWLFTIARNLALTRMERGKRTEPLAAEEESVYYRFDPDRLENPETAAQAFEMAALVWEASKALDPKQQTLLELHVRQGLDSAEIATVLGVSKGNAYTMVSRLKDAFESAVAGLMMFRVGRRDCPELNRLLTEHRDRELTASLRKLIERHTPSCDTCRERRRQLVSAASLLRALVPVSIAPELAGRIGEQAWASAQQPMLDAASATDATTSPDGAAQSWTESGQPMQGAGPSGATPAPAGSGGGMWSGAARVLQSLPGPAWLPAVVGVVAIAAVAALVAVSVRPGGDAGSGGVLAGEGGPTPTAAAAVEPVADLADAASISAGGTTTCAVREGAVWCWGAGLAPAPVAGMSDGVTAVSSGADNTTCAIKDGGVWCWVIDDPSRTGGSGVTKVPERVPSLSDGVTALSVGRGVACAVQDGSAWCWGNNENGQLGNNTTIASAIPLQVAGLTSGVTAVAAYGASACAIQDGGVWCWGWNVFGQLGDGTFDASPIPVAVAGLSSGVSALAVGTSAACAVKDSGVWCWGYNFNDSLRIGGETLCGADACSPSPLPVRAMDSDVSAIATDGRYTCAVKDGGAWCWGMGHGIGRTAAREPAVMPDVGRGVTAVAVGANHACALQDGEAWCWGINDRGQLGEHDTLSSVDVPLLVGGLDGAGAAETPSAPVPTVAIDDDAARLRAAISAQSPGIGFDPECSASNPDGPCVTGSWPASVLATGIAPVSIHGRNGDGAATFYGRRADGTWVYWFGTQNSGGPQTSLPGQMIVCADGDGLNLRAEPSTTAAVITLIPDGTLVSGDRFVMTDPPSPGDGMPPHPDGWYHITSPQEGWAYDRYLLGYANGVTACIDTWWP